MARPLPYDHSPSERRARQQASDAATGSAACSTSTSRSHDVCTVSGTHTLDGPQRAAIAEPLVAVASADGVIAPGEVTTLTKIFTLLGLDPATDPCGVPEVGLGV